MFTLKRGILSLIVVYFSKDLIPVHGQIQPNNSSSFGGSNILGKLYCQPNGKYQADSKMQRVYQKCPADIKSKKINWATVDSTNCNQMLQLGKLFTKQYKCIFGLIGALNLYGGLNPKMALQYSSIFQPKSASRFMRYRLFKCIRKYMGEGYGFGVANCNWVEFSACQIAAELEACQSDRTFRTTCDSQLYR